MYNVCRSTDKNVCIFKLKLYSHTKTGHQYLLTDPILMGHPDIKIILCPQKVPIIKFLFDLEFRVT